MLSIHQTTNKLLIIVLQRVNMQRVFPSLCTECTNNNMVPFVLPNMILIAEKASDADFSKHIFPAFIPLFQITDPIQVSNCKSHRPSVKHWKL